MPGILSPSHGPLLCFLPTAAGFKTFPLLLLLLPAKMIPRGLLITTPRCSIFPAEDGTMQTR